MPILCFVQPNRRRIWGEKAGPKRKRQIRAGCPVSGCGNFPFGADFASGEGEDRKILRYLVY